jgi:hypothetical protein
MSFKHNSYMSSYHKLNMSSKHNSYMLIHFYLIEHCLLSFILSNAFLSFWRPETLTLFRFTDLLLNPQNNNTYLTN